MKILIVGAGHMANQHAAKFASFDGVELAGVVEPREEIREAFCEKHNIKNSFTNLDEAIAWGEFDSATIVTPDNAHKDAVLALVAVNKHVLCEKPLAPSFEDANEMTLAAEKAGVINMVNLTYRMSKALQQAHKVVASGALGSIKHIQANYLQSWLVQDSWGQWSTEPTWLWRLSSEHGSLGVLGDIGVHLLDFACYASGETIEDVNCLLRTFEKADNDQIGEYTLDANDSVVITASLSGKGIAVFQASRFMSGHHNDLALTIHGDKGALKVMFSNTPVATDKLSVCLDEDLKTCNWKDVELKPVPMVMATFAQAVIANTQKEPSFRRASDMQKIIDLAFEADRKKTTLTVT